MLKETKYNIIHETAKLIVAGEKDFNECDREMKDMVIWYLRFDKKNAIADIAIKLKCEWNTAALSIKRSMKQRALQLEKEGIDIYTEFIEFKKSIELIKDEALAKGDLSIYLQSLFGYMSELRKCGFIKDNATIPV